MSGFRKLGHILSSHMNRSKFCATCIEVVVQKYFTCENIPNYSRCITVFISKITNKCVSIPID